MKYFIHLLAGLLASLFSFANAPTVPATNLSFNVIEGGYFNVGWTPGNGSRRIMIVRAGLAVTAVPQNGMDYTENTVFGTGQAILPGQYVVYDNAFTSFFLTGLSPATEYFFAVYEYNGTGAGTEYLTTSFLSGSASTVSAPTIQASGIFLSNITATSVLLNLQPGNGSRRLIVARESSPVNSDPVNLQPYSGSNSFGSGAQLGIGNFSVYSSTGNNVNVTNLKSGTTYFFSVYEYNGNGQPVYLLPAATSSVSTRTVPTIPSSAATIVKTDGKELTLNWTSGNGQRRIVVAKQGSALSASPVNGIDYTANEIFGNGSTVTTGEFVVFSGTGNGAIIKGLNAATTYFFRIYEYDGTGNNTLYLASSFATVNGSTAITPTQQVSTISATNVLATSLSLTWAAGNGRARIIIARKDAAVNINLQDFTLYTGNSDFGTGQELGNGNFVLGYTTEQFLNVHTLQPNSTYHFAVYELNGFNQPLYLVPGAIFNVTTVAVVPVILSDWKVVAREGKVGLDWTTQSEINASHFNVQRSADGNNFITVTITLARGNSQVAINYNDEDISPLAGNSFYRLEMVDADGKVGYSNIVKIVRAQDYGRVQLYIGPGSQKLEVAVPAQPRNFLYQWRIVNAGGQVLKTGVISSGNMQIDIQAIGSGMYWLQVNIEGKLRSGAFIKR